MELELGNGYWMLPSICWQHWFLPIFGDMDSPSALVFAILVMVILFGAGLVLVYDYGNHKDKGINKKKGKWLWVHKWLICWLFLLLFCWYVLLVFHGLFIVVGEKREWFNISVMEIGMKQKGGVRLSTMKALLLLLFVCIIPIIQVLETEHGWIDKGIQCSAFLLRWATCSPGSIDETADATHLQ